MVNVRVEFPTAQCVLEFNARLSMDHIRLQNDPTGWYSNLLCPADDDRVSVLVEFKRRWKCTEYYASRLLAQDPEDDECGMYYIHASKQ